MFKVKHIRHKDSAAYSEICQAFDMEQRLAKIVNNFWPKYLPGVGGGGAAGWENRPLCRKISKIPQPKPKSPPPPPPTNEKLLRRGGVSKNQPRQQNRKTNYQ